MSFQIDTAEIDALAKTLTGAQQIIDEEMARGMTRSALQVEASAKALVPVKTGHLRRSITHQVTATATVIKARVGTNVPYAEWVEEGRKGFSAAPGKMLRFVIDGEVFYRKSVGPQAAQPYMAPALKNNRAKIAAEFATAVPKRIVARLGLS